MAQHFISAGHSLDDILVAVVDLPQRDLRQRDDRPTGVRTHKSARASSLHTTANYELNCASFKTLKKSVIPKRRLCYLTF